MKAPNFSLPDQNGTIHSLAQYLGKWVVVYFYPKDDTPGCTKEACGFRDVAKEFAQHNVIILGISKDSTNSHQKFASKYSLTFPLLSDPDHQVAEMYGAWGEKKFMGKTYQGILRHTYLIDSSGHLVKTYHQVNPLTHATTVLQDVKAYSKNEL